MGGAIVAQRVAAADREVTTTATLSVGDALYAESSETIYWVREITETSIVLENVEGIPCTWPRETLEASLDTHTWIQQS